MWVIRIFTEAVAYVNLKCSCKVIPLFSVQQTRAKLKPSLWSYFEATSWFCRTGAETILVPGLNETSPLPVFTTHVQYTQTDTIRQTDGPLVPMVRLVPIEKYPIPMVLLVHMHLIKGNKIIIPCDLVGYRAIPMVHWYQWYDWYQ